MCHRVKDNKLVIAMYVVTCFISYLDEFLDVCMLSKLIAHIAYLVLAPSLCLPCGTKPLYGLGARYWNTPVFVFQFCQYLAFSVFICRVPRQSWCQSSPVEQHGPLDQLHGPQ
jgi:hypothetical protein